MVICYVSQVLSASGLLALNSGILRNYEPRTQTPLHANPKPIESNMKTLLPSEWAPYSDPPTPDWWPSTSFTAIPSRDIVAECMLHCTEQCPGALRADLVYNVQGCKDPDGEHAICKVCCQLGPRNFFWNIN